MQMVELIDKCNETRDRLLLIGVLLEQLGNNTPRWFPTKSHAELIELISEQIEKCADDLKIE